MRMPGPASGRAAIRLAVAAGAVIVTMGCTGGDPDAASTASAPAPDTAERVALHLLDHGARRALRADPGGYRLPGSLVLPRGGATCTIASITVGAHGPLVTDAVFDRSGTVTVRIRAAGRDLDRCLAAARVALRGFDAAGG